MHISAIVDRDKQYFSNKADFRLAVSTQIDTWTDGTVLMPITEMTLTATDTASQVRFSSLYIPSGSKTIQSVAVVKTTRTVLKLDGSWVGNIMTTTVAHGLSVGDKGMVGTQMFTVLQVINATSFVTDKQPTTATLSFFIVPLIIAQELIQPPRTYTPNSQNDIIVIVETAK